MVDEPIEVGRECDGLMVADPLASRRHVVLRCVDGVLWATDLGSSNGTWLNGELVEGTNEVAAGCVLRVGSTTITVEDGWVSG
jgi:pSer/pThr/pTyr-binding forkhead associated (FHA) protein